MVTGGPESLHNLCSLLRSLGFNAEMVYFPFVDNHTVPAAYVKYKVEVSGLQDAPHVLVIFPETLCMPALQVRHAKSVIWWLSVDGFYEKRDNDFRDTLRYFRRALKGKRPLGGIQVLSKLIHFSKCHYDETFLTSKKFPFMRLSGPISHAYINFYRDHDVLNFAKKDIILYNPKKTSTKLIERLSKATGFVFKGLVNLDESGLIETFSTSKLYIDFGNHPGQERMPREAVACGCCILTGLKGSAANLFDIPIPNIYKLNEFSPDFIEKFNNIANLILNNYQSAYKDFEIFRNSVLQSHEIQKAECLHIMKSLKVFRKNHFQ